MALVSDESSTKETVFTSCSVHHEEKAVLYCTECSSDQTACLFCLAPRGRHANHRIVSLEEGLNRAKSDYVVMLETVQQSCSKVKKKRKQTEESHEILLCEVEKSSRKINRHINRLIADLEHLRIDLHMWVLQAAQTARQRATTREEHKRSCRNLHTATQYMKELRKLLACDTLSDLLNRRSTLPENFGRFEAAIDYQGSCTTIPNFVSPLDAHIFQEITTLTEQARKLRESLATADYCNGTISGRTSSSVEHTEVLFRVGGFNSTVLNTAELYDTAKEQWLQVAPMSTARMFPAAAYWNGKVVVTGGKDEVYVTLQSAEQYDCQSNQWSTFVSLNTARNGHTMVNFAESLFVIAGWGFRNALHTVERFNSEVDQWQPASFLTCPRGDFAAAALQNGIVVAGGRNKNVLSSCEYYCKQSNMWSPIAPLKVARQFASAAAHSDSDSVFVFGGQDSSNRYLDDAEQYDFTANKWTVLQTRSSVARCCSVARVNNFVYILGSTALRNGRVLAERFEPLSGSYSQVTTLPQTCCRFAATSACVSTSVLKQLAQKTAAQNSPFA